MNNENGKRRKVGVVGYGHLGEIFFKIFVDSFCSLATYKSYHVARSSSRRVTVS